jgi:hypothetical protein
MLSKCLFLNNAEQNKKTTITLGDEWIKPTNVSRAKSAYFWQLFLSPNKRSRQQNRYLCKYDGKKPFILLPAVKYGDKKFQFPK